MASARANLLTEKPATHSEAGAGRTPAQRRKRKRTPAQLAQAAAQKKAGLPPHLTPGNPGNSGGKKGRSGRKPGSWKQWCKKVVSGKSAAKAIRKVLRNPNHPAFGAMVKFIGEQGYGKAEASVNLKASSLEALIAGSMAEHGKDA